MVRNVLVGRGGENKPRSNLNTPEEWLDEFNTFSIYQLLPKLIALWGLNVQTDVQAKKNFARLSGQ